MPPASKNDENIKMLYSRRQFLDEYQLKSSDSLDKYLFSFSSGAIYLTLLFFEKGFENKIWMTLGLKAMLLVIFTSLVSILLSIKATKCQIEIIDEKLNDLNKKGETCSHECNPWKAPITYFNIASVLFFISGMVALSTYYLTNL